MYHKGNRELQAHFGSTVLANRLFDVTHRTGFSDSDRAFIESAGFFFLATADTEGRPDCSLKGGPPGFVRIVADNALVFPDYDGNGLFKSLGNILVNPYVGLLFIALDGSPRRLRVNGKAQIDLDRPAFASVQGAQALVRVEAKHIFPNCPRYIPDLQKASQSKFNPNANQSPIEPEWKSFDEFKDVVPKRKDGTATDD
jgi:predicted pyridoxine 5'-phosphate oxidase superfamily flavin-nucleotide-binding protein